MLVITKRTLFLFTMLLVSLYSVACDKTSVSIVGTPIDNGTVITYNVQVCLGISPNWGETASFTLDGNQTILSSGYTSSITTDYNYCSQTLSFNGQGCAVVAMGQAPAGGTVINASVTSSGTVSGGNLTYTAPTMGEPIGPNDMVADCADCGNSTQLCVNITFQTASGSALTTLTLVNAEGGNNCPDEIVTVPAPVTSCVSSPVASASASTTTICSGGSAILTGTVTGGTTPYLYNWTPSGSLSSFNTLTATATPTGTTTYSFNATDAMGCPSNSATVTINVNQLPYAELTTPQEYVCTSGATTTAPISFLNGTAPWSFVYSNGTTTTAVSTSSNPHNLTLGVGSYSLVSVQDANGCAGTVGGTTQVSASGINIDAGADFLNPGNGNTYNINATTTGGIQGYNVSLTEELFNGSTNISIPDATVGAGGGPDSVTTCITTSGITQSVLSSGNIDEICFTVTHAKPSELDAKLIAPSGAIYLLPDVISGLNCFPYSDLLSFLVGEDANGQFCLRLTDNKKNTTGVINSWYIDFNSIDTTFLPFTYTWDASNSEPTSALSSLSSEDVTFTSPSDAFTGCYTVIVEDGLGCTDSDEICITSSVCAATLNTTVTNVSCFGSSTGAVTTSIGGTGTTPYSYIWSNGATTANISSVVAGTYVVTFTDAGTCNITATVTISQPSQALNVTLTPTNVTCNGLSSGSVAVSVAGGTTAYSYNWSNSATTSSLSSRPAGTYTLTVTDANSCTVSSTTTITQPTALTITSSDVDVLCFGNSTGSVDVSFSGGTTPYTYLWSSGQSTQDLTSIVSGTYTVTATDNIGCTRTSSATITQPSAALSASIVGVTDEDCGLANAQADASASGGTTSYSYTWQNGQTTLQATGLSAGSIFVTVTDANGCSTTSSSSVASAGGMTVSSTVTDVTCNGDADGAIDITPSGGTGVFSFVWSNASTDQNISGLIQGNYTVTVTDDGNSCEFTLTESVSQPSGLSATVSCSPTSTLGGTDGASSSSISGGVTPYTYSWSNGGTDASISGLTQNTYTLTVTDANLCTATDACNVVDPACGITLTPSAFDASCFSGSDGSASVLASGGTTPYAYLWSSGSTDDNTSGLVAANYTVTITDAALCEESISLTIAEPSAVSITLSESISISCFGLSDGEISSSVSGGASPYSYLWNNSSTTTDIAGISTGTYTLSVTDNNGCLVEEGFTISEPAELTAGINENISISCFGVSDGELEVLPIGGTTPYSYSWSDAQTDAAASGLGTGTYSVTVIDNNICVTVESYTISEPSLLAVSSSTTLASCGNTDGDGTVISSVNGGTTPYTYSWSDGQTDATATGLTAGSYTVTVLDANMCEATISDFVSNSLPNLTITVGSNVSCFGGSDANAQVIPGGGETPYTYTWSNGETSDLATGLSAGTYFVTVTDNINCVAVQSSPITQPGGISIVLSPLSPSCLGESSGEITATVSGGTTPYSYMWSNSETTLDLADLVSGTYTLSVTDDNSCSAENSADISIPSPLDASVTQTDVTCAGASDGTATALVTGGTTPYAFVWSNGQTDAIATGLASGSYTVTISDAGGCSFLTIDNTPVSSCLEIKRILVDACGSIEGEEEMFFMQTGPSDLNTSDLAIDWPNNSWQGACTNPTFITNTNALIVNGGFLKEPVGGVIPANSNVLVVVSTSPNTSSMSFVDLSDTLYVVFQCDDGNPSTSGHFANYNATAGIRTLIVDFGSGCTDQVSYDRTLLVKQDLTIGAQDGATVEFDDAGLATYTNIGCTAPFDTSEVFSFLSAEILEPAALSVSLTTNNVSCFGASDANISTAVSGGTSPYSYLWSNGSTDEAISGLDNGTFTVTVIDANLCETASSATITEPTDLIYITSAADITCFGANDAYAGVTVFGGTTPYSYSWSSGETVDMLSPLAEGSYEVTMTDANGCSELFAITITEPESMSVTPNTTNEYCNLSNGYTYIDVSGGSSPYVYEWNTGETTVDLNDIVAGTYTVTVSDIEACSASIEVTVGATSTYSISLTETSTLCVGSADGTLSVVASGGVTPFSYLWSDGQTDATATGLPTAAYYVTVTDAQSCVVMETSFIDEPTPLAITGSSSSAYCGLANGTAGVTASGGTSPYSYLWGTSETTDSVSGLVDGLYDVTVTDNNGCTISSSTTVNLIQDLSVSLTGQTDVTCFNGDDGETFVDVVGGLTPYSYLWSDSSTSEDATGLSAGTFTLTVTDNMGCERNVSATISEPSAISITPSSTNTTCQTNNGSASVSASGGQGTFSYNWSNGNTDSFVSGLAIGTYTVTITDGSGCTSSSIININAGDSPMILSFNTNDAACGDNDGSSTVTVASGGSSPFTYLWGNGNTNSSASGLTQGTFGVTITDNIGCIKVGTATIGQEAGPVADFEFTVTDDVAPAYIDFTNLSTQANTYSWEFGTGDSSNAASPSYQFLIEGDYIVTLTAYSANGLCSDTATGKVSLVGISELFMPNVFSPNGDGTNDFFYVKSDNLEELHVSIVNRWGVLVYEIKSPLERWDGKSYSGEDMPDGTYFYILKAQGFDEHEYEEKGYITLVRKK